MRLIHFTHDPLLLAIPLRSQQWRTEGGFGVVQPLPPPNSEVLPKLGRISSSVENHRYQPNQNTGFTDLQIEWNP
jgi:hypothetical protein